MVEASRLLRHVSQVCHLTSNHLSCSLCSLLTMRLETLLCQLHSAIIFSLALGLK